MKDEWHSELFENVSDSDDTIYNTEAHSKKTPECTGFDHDKKLSCSLKSPQAREDIYSEWRVYDSIENSSDVFEIQSESSSKYWGDLESAKLNRLLVEEYDEKCDEIRTQMEETVDILYQDCCDIADDEQVYSRFKNVRSHQDFELFDQRMWQKKAPESALGYHSPFDNSIGLRDGELILEEATHECIHSLSYRGVHTMYSPEGTPHEILRSGLRSIDMTSGKNFARGINEGMTQMYTRHVLDHQYKAGKPKRLIGAYEQETKWATDLRTLAGKHAVDRAYFNGDTEELVTFVNRHTGIPDGWNSFCALIDEYQSAQIEGDLGRKKQMQIGINNMFILMRINSRKGDDSL